jgi:DNA-binding SARP family transcriptional activator
VKGVRIRVLGPVEARVGGEVVDLGGRRQRSVLQRLLVARGQVVPVDRVVDDLWRGEPPRQAIGALQVYVSHLRRVLEPGRPPRAPAQVLVTSPPGYVVRLDPEAVDAWAFEGAVREGRALLAADDPAEALARFGEGLGLWGGPAYGEVAKEDWAAAEAGRLSELHALAREGQAQALMDRGDAAGAVAELEAMTAEHPLREEGWRLLALALHGAGRRADALGALHRARRLLHDSFGIEPGLGLAEVERAILAHDVHALAPARSRLVATVTSGDRKGGQAPGDVGPGTYPECSGEVPVTATPGVPAGTPETFVGRRAELAALEAAASRAAAGHATVALVGGDPGSGKTTLVEQAGDRLAAEGWRVVFGRCPEADGAPPAWAWTQLLGSLDHDAWPTTQAPEGGFGGHSAVERFRLHQTVLAMLGACLQDAPRGLALVFDDLHRADGETLAMLRSVVEGLGRQRLLVLAAYRTTEVDARLEDTVAALATRITTRLRLGGLGAADAALLVAEVAGRPVPAEVLAQLVSRTGGNPFFLRESARLLASEGAPAALAAVPDGVRDVLRRRLARLPASAVSVLRLAALVGRDIDVDVLAEAADVSEMAVLAGLEAGLLAGLLTEPSPGVVRFTHVMVREVLEGDLFRLRRTHWHTRLAAAYERLRPGDLAALAHHHGRAATPATAERAFECTTRAARAAEARFAHDTAAALWRQAGELLDVVPAGSGRGGPGERVELAGYLLRAQVLAGMTVEARATRDLAVRTAAATGDDELLARALTLWEAPTVWVSRDYARRDDDTIALVERLLAATPRKPPDTAAAERRCRLLCVLATELAGEAGSRALDAAAEAVELARTVGDPGLLCQALHAQASPTSPHATAGERRRIATELGELAERHGLAHYQVISHHVAIQTDAADLDVVGMRRHLAAAKAITQQYQLLESLGPVTAAEGMILHIEGRFHEAEAAYLEASADMRRRGSYNPDAAELVALVTLRMSQDRMAELVEPTGHAAAEFGSFAVDMHVLALLAAGDTHRARAAWRERSPCRRDIFWLICMAMQAYGAIGLGELEEAEAAYAELAPWESQLAGASSAAFTVGPVAQVLGDLAGALGRPQDAASHYQKAAKVATRVGSRPWLEAAQRHLA